MWPDRVVVTPPTLDDDLGFAQRVEDFTIEQFIAQAGIKTLDVTILPGATWCDLGGLCADCCDPILHSLGEELRAIVGSDVARDATQDEEVRENIDYIDGLELAGDPDRQAFVGKLIDHIEHAIFPSIVGPILDKIVGPDVIAVLGTQPDARPIRKPEPAALGLFMGDLQPLASPDPLDPLVVDQPALLLQQPGDLAIPVTAVLPGQCDEIGRQLFFVITAPRYLALRRAMLPERRTGAALGDMHDLSDLLDTGAATRGA